VNDSVMVYVRIASGYRPGGPNFQATPQVPAIYAADKDTNYEMGVKANLPQQRVSFDLAVFYIDWTNVQLPLLTPLNLAYTGNAGSVTSKGVEASLNYVPVRALNISGAVAYTEAQLEKSIPSGAYGAKGDQLPYSPLWKANFGADYSFNPMGKWVPYVGAWYFLNSSELSNFAPASGIPRVYLPAYQTFNARLGMRNDRWTTQIFVKNIADKRAFNGASALTGDPAGPYAAGIIQPRTIGISLIAKF